MTDKPKRGRPPLSAGEDTVPVYLRATASQRDAWTTAAERRGTPLAEWARRVLDRAARR